jgi:hypothetical protein
MAFTTSELARIKAELGYNLLQVGADVYVGVTQLFEQVVNTNVPAEIRTTSATNVTAQTSPTPVALTLVDATGFAAGEQVVVDVDGRREKATIAALSGSAITTQLSLAHSGTYPVSVVGPIVLVREALGRIDAVKAKMSTTFGAGALKRVDEVEFYAVGRNGKSQFGALGDELAYWRNEIASILGVPNAWAMKPGGGGCVALSVY